MQVPLTAVTSVIDGLKRLYVEKLKPLEVAYRFNDFASPLLVWMVHIYWKYIEYFHANWIIALFLTYHYINCTIFQTSSDFDAKPMVMLLGQYSTGKTTFIKHLLQTSYPGSVIELIV